MAALKEYWPLLIEGLGMTVLITTLGLVVTVVVAFTAGLARLSRLWLVRAPAYIFIEVFRGTSLVVQLFWFFYALPFLGFEFTPIAAAVIVLGLNEGSYAAEIVRGTVASRPRGQTDACVALGLSPGQRMRRVLLPQSIPAMLPSFGNVFVDLLKATALVSLVTITDLTFAAQTARNFTGETTIIFMTIMLLYFSLAMLLAWLTRYLESRFAIDRPPTRSLWSLVGGGQGAIRV